MIRLLSLYIIMCISITVCAQTRIVDKELVSLVDVVKTLRVSNKKTFNNAVQKLSEDVQWKPMNDTGKIREGVECKATEDIPRFRLNTILSRILGSRKYESSHGDMIRGTAASYHYLLYERALKANSEVQYNLKDRKGKQTFVIVPYNKSANFTAHVGFRGIQIEGVKQADGTIVVSWSTNLPSPSQEFFLYVKNNMSDPQSFVIINHNTCVE